jgi:hypothetical protein
MLISFNNYIPFSPFYVFTGTGLVGEELEE